MRPLEIGDRGIGNSECLLKHHVGMTATVVGIDTDGDYQVRWENGEEGGIERRKLDPLPGMPPLPTDSAKRKEYPMYSGLLAFFPAALAEVSNHSFLGSQKHNPGKPMQHSRGLSGDHADCVVRHLVDAHEHPKGSKARIEELRALAWRSLALLQEELESTGVKAAPGATFDDA